MMKKGSLSGRFILVVLIILIIGQSALWLWFLMGQRKQQRDLLKAKITSSADLLENAAGIAIVTSNYMYLDQFIDVMGDRDMLSVKVMDKAGNVLREKVFRVDKGGGLFNPLYIFYIPGSNRHMAPIEVKGQNVGIIEIIYSGERANENIMSLFTVPPLMQAMVFLFVIYAIYFFFRKWVGRSIEKLNSQIAEVTAGDLTVDIDIDRGGEIGKIADGFKFLVEKLSHTILKLNSTSDNVAMAIKQLDMTFKNVHQGMQRQARAMDEMAVSLKSANESQKKITEGTDKLSEFSTENVTSLLEMRSAAEEIVGNTVRLSQAVDDSYSVVSEMSQTAKAIADNSGKVLSSVEDTSASVEEISVSVKEIEKSAKDSTELAERVRQIAAEKGVLTVVEAIEGMDKITERVKYSVDVVTRLGARSKDIEKMLSVIKEVTEQTNLLSLNAAILAVQAGEFGKGFSVVADEIRALSDRTAVSTKEIAGIVSTIQKEIADVVVSIESGMQLVEEGSALVYTAGEHIATVVEEAQKSARMARSIEKATEEQAKGLGQIMASVDNIRSMISQAARATEEQFKGSGYMLEKLGEVKESAESSKKGSEEQAAGIKLISKNIELATDRVGEINQSAIKQQDVNEGIILAIEQIRNIGLSALTDVDAVSLSLRTLQEEIQTLKKEMETFKVK